MSWTPPRSVNDVDLRAIFLSLSSFMDGLASGPGSVVTATLADGSVTTPKLADLAVTSAKLGDLSVTNAKLGASSVTADKIAAGVVESLVQSRGISDGVTSGSWYGLYTLGAGYWTLTSATASFSSRDVGKAVYSSSPEGTGGVTTATWKPGAYIYSVLSSTQAVIKSNNARQTLPDATTGLKVTIGGLTGGLDTYTTDADDVWGFRQYSNITFQAGEARTWGDVGINSTLDITIDGHGQNIFPLTGYGPSGIFNIFAQVTYKTKAGYRGGGVSFLSNVWHDNDPTLTDPDPYTVMFGCIMQPYINSWGEHLTYHGQIDVERTMLEGYVDQPVIQGQERSGYWGTLDFRGFDVTSFEGDEFVQSGVVLGERNGAWMRETPRLDIRTIAIDNLASTANAIYGGLQITVGMTGKTFIFDTPISSWPNAGEFYVFVMDNLTDRNFVGSARITYTGKGATTGSGPTLRYYLTGCTVEDGPSGYLDDADPRGRLTVATTYTSFQSTSVTTNFGTAAMNGELADEIVVGSTTNFGATGYVRVPSGGSTGESIIYYGGKTSTKFTYCQLISGGGTTVNGSTVVQIYPATAAYFNGEASDVLRILDTTAWGSGVPAGVSDFKFTVMADDGPFVGTYRATSTSSGVGQISYVTAYSKDRSWIRDGAQISTSGIIQRRYGYRIDPLFRAQYGYPFLYGYSASAYTWLMDKYGTDYKRLASSSSGLHESIESWGAPLTERFYRGNGSQYSPTQAVSANVLWTKEVFGRTGAGGWIKGFSERVEATENMGTSAGGSKWILALTKAGASTHSDILRLSNPTGTLPSGGLLAEILGRLEVTSKLSVLADGMSVVGDIAMGGSNAYTVSNLKTPTTDYQAATKKYVDDSVAGVAGKAYIFGTSIVSDVAPGGTSGTYADLTGVTWTVPSTTLAASGDKLKLTLSFTTGTTGNPATNLAFRILMGPNVMWDTDTYWATTATAGVITAQCELIRTSTTGIRMIGRTASRNVTVTANKGTEYTGGLTVNNMDSASNVVKVQAKHTHTADIVLTSAVLEVIKA